VGDTVRDVARAGIPPLGVHLSLTLGKAVAGQGAVPGLVDDRNDFKWTSRGLLLRSFAGAKEQALLAQIRREFEAQLGLARDHGLRPSHADSHQHVHMNPAIFSVVEEILPRFGIERLRYSREGLSLRAASGLLRHRKYINVAKVGLLRWLSRRVRPDLATTDAFVGILDSGVLSKQALTSAILGLRENTSLEICIHPGFPARASEAVYPLAYVNDFISSPGRQGEHDVLIDPAIGELVRRRGLVLRDFAGRKKPSAR
jgi:predicted glycoside hydrolase/deacetylase ChbG (UPF0249 family)